jgi:phenylpropionate dioxygenase-like ring-hydroxylating dioxygenase large terminal subunit
MYPFKEGHVYARNQWYVLGWSTDFGASPVRRVVMDEPILLYRSERGAPIAIADRCAHRHFPLSKGGKRRGDLIVCGYHGLTYDSTGACVHIPSQDRIPGSCKIKAYPLVEAWNWVWIWMGDPRLADPARIVDHFAIGLTDPKWEASIGFDVPLKARYQLLNENLLDLTHATFLHPETIGTDEVAEAEIVFEEGSGFLRDGRYMRSVRAPELFKDPLELDDVVDRDLLIDFYPPGLHVGWEQFKRCGVSDDSPERDYGQLKVYHALTPETQSTTHYFFAFARTFAKGDQAFTDHLREGLFFVVNQDREALNALEENLALESDLPREFSCRSDAGVLRGRRHLESLIAAEMAASDVSETFSK